MSRRERGLTRASGPAQVQCLQCDQPVRWWRLPSHVSSWVIVDFSPDDAGSIARLATTWTDPQTGREVPQCRVLHGDALAEALADGELLFTRHSSTCSARNGPGAQPLDLGL